MNFQHILRFFFLSLFSLSGLSLVSCSSFEHSLTRHDADGDGFVSHSEYQQNHMQYNLARSQRVDEYDRARQITRHVYNAGDIIGGVDRGLGMLRNFGR